MVAGALVVGIFIDDDRLDDCRLHCGYAHRPAAQDVIRHFHLNRHEVVQT